MLRGRGAGASMQEGWYRTLAEMLPNVTYVRADGERVNGIATHVVLGRIVDVERGRGFRIEGDDAPGGIPTDYGDGRARWWTVHATVEVERALASAAPERIKVMFPSDGPSGFAKMQAGLKALGRVVLFLRNDSTLTAYDRSLYWAMEEEGTVMATVAADGTLALEFMPERRARELLVETPRLSDLEAKAAAPRVIPMVGAAPYETRADGR